MRGLLLTGPTGVGKSTAQEKLRAKHGFWIPRTCTTRAVDSSESDFVHLQRAEFLDAVQSGEIVLPASFGAEWYGWTRRDLQTLQHEEGRAVLNVRPYTALILQATLTNFRAVWLTLDEEHLTRRRNGRHASRDTNEPLRQLREVQDQEDLKYKPCFANVFEADDGLVNRLLGFIP